MAENKTNPYMAYGALAGAIAVVITAVADYQMAVNPAARPDAFTGSDGDKLRAYCDRELAELRAEIIELKHWRNAHTEWGNKLHAETQRWRGKIDAEHHDFSRRLRREP